MRAIVGGLARPEAGFGFAVRRGGRDPAPAGSTIRYGAQMEEHVVERGETSALRCKQRLNPSRSCGANRGMRKVTGSVEAGRSLMVVQDVEGAIVTGVLGGD
jgi:hypothetical protein